MSETRNRQRWELLFGSLRTQLAIGSALVALGSITLVTILALVGVNLTTLNSQQSTISLEAAHRAQMLGQGHTNLLGYFQQQSVDTTVLKQPGAIFTSSTFDSYTTWIMDLSGDLTAQMAISGETSGKNDITAIRAALQKALHGQEHEDVLPSSPSWFGAIFSPQSVHWYAALPIHAQGENTGSIIGAVVLSSPSTSGKATVGKAIISKNPSLLPEFLELPDMGNWMILGIALIIAFLAVIVAILFARRLTRPLKQLVVATQAVRAGNYAARVRLHASGEIQQVIETFNVMAATLEADMRQFQDQERQRRELLAVVAHDLATPLTMIQGYTEALAEGVVHDAPKRTTVTRIIGREVARLRRLVDQLRQMALVEAGVAKIQLQPVSLDAIVTETLTALTPARDGKQLTLSTEGLRELPPIMADPDRMTEILVNLVENAIRYTPTGGQITISGVADADAIRVRIADTGPGIPSADRKRVFDQFTRLDETRNSASGGAGLGLAIVRALVIAQHGTIQIEDAAGTGACFTMSFPRSNSVLTSCRSAT
jgi:two-component system, OmpR family, sensor histidine kinase BaeS